MAKQLLFCPFFTNFAGLHEKTSKTYDMALELSEQEQLRRQSLTALRNLGIEPYPAARYEVTATAREIARQIRLRGISGLILVDFINMPEKEQEERLLGFLQGLVREDPVPTKVVDMTALHLVELTRKKIRRPLAEQMK